MLVEMRVCLAFEYAQIQCVWEILIKQSRWGELWHVKIDKCRDFLEIARILIKRDLKCCTSVLQNTIDVREKRMN